jgi:hypothetical protein
MIADLAVKPGMVAREYIGGKRKKYYSPFTFFILSIGLLVFSSHYFRVLEEPQKADPRMIAQLPTESAKKKYVNLITRMNTGTQFISKNMNTIAMLVLPFYAFLSWIFFRRRGYNYSELMVAYMLFQSFVTLFLAILLIPWIGKYKNEPFFFYVYGVVVLLNSIYVGAAQYKFLGFKNRWAIVLTSFVALLGYLFVFVFMILGIFYYIFGSNAGTVLKTMLQKLF